MLLNKDICAHSKQVDSLSIKKCSKKESLNNKSNNVALKHTSDLNAACFIHIKHTVIILMMNEQDVHRARASGIAECQMAQRFLTCRLIASGINPRPISFIAWSFPMTEKSSPKTESWRKVRLAHGASRWCLERRRVSGRRARATCPLKYAELSDASTQEASLRQHGENPTKKTATPRKIVRRRWGKQLSENCWLLQCELHCFSAERARFHGTSGKTGTKLFWLLLLLFVLPKPRCPTVQSVHSVYKYIHLYVLFLRCGYQFLEATH